MPRGDEAPCVQTFIFVTDINVLQHAELKNCVVSPLRVGEAIAQTVVKPSLGAAGLYSDTIKP